MFQSFKTHLSFAIYSFVSNCKLHLYVFQHFYQLFLNYCCFYMVCYPTHLISVQIKFSFERFLTDINQPNHIPACVQHRVIQLVPN